ncbi:Alpha/Beta hydrolase protein [Podospora fimiseda]|uniref:Alpha/Beta hydrolase protein n=1 Tax=Podospora fimiseda TaxID=252190 RepID=A0AAN7BTL9_9PEZI|nr:Alpha/Beta hydrolase protein [Podospora fimiseda]
MASEKPTILFSHGAWHPPHLYQPLKDALAKKGYTLIVPALATMGTKAIGVGWDADVDVLLNEAVPLFEQGKEVVLVGHSYGGIPATIATRDNGIAERAAAGLKGGFKHVVFLAAFALPQAGLSNLTAVPGEQWMPWHTVLESDDGEKQQLFVNDLSKDLLYNDMPQEQAEAFYKDLVPQSYAAVIQPVPFAVPDITIPKTYIVCERDAAFPVPLQDYLATALGFNKKTIDAGHSCFASAPDELADLLIEIAEEN